MYNDHNVKPLHMMLPKTYAYVRGHSKSTFVEEGRESLKSEQIWKGGGGGGVPTMCVCSLFLKQMLRFSKRSLIVILQFLLLIIMTAWNIKQAIMEDYNIQSCQWMAYNGFRQPFLLCTTFRSFLCTVHHVLAHFQQKWLLIHWL